MAQSLYRKASLVMNPYGAKDTLLPSIKPTDGSGDFTFSRDGAGASPATRVNASGLIEKGRENELTYSNTFSDSDWGKSGVTLTSGQAGYDGTNNAWLLSSSVASNHLFQNVSTNLNTISIYAKAGTLNWMAINFGGGFIGSYFDLQNGTLGSVQNAGSGITIEAKIEQVGTTDWYRCSVAGSYINAATTFRIYTASADLDTSGAGNIYIQDAQLESGLVATDYIETTTAPVSAGLLGDMPRLDYSGGATCPSLLLEPSRVNNLPYSEYLGASNWTKTNVAITDNATTSPEGVVNAAQITENASGLNLYGPSDTLVGSASAYTYSAFLKQGSLRYGGIRAIVNGFANRFFVNVDLQEGTITDTDTTGTGVTWSYDIENYGNGWHRVWISATNTSGNIDLAIGLSNSATPTYASGLPYYTGTGSDYIYAYGAQVEVGSYPTSYIPTYGSASTRGADFGNDNDLVDTAISFGANDDFTLFYEGSFNDLSSTSNMLMGGGRQQLGASYKNYWWAQNATSMRIVGEAETLMAYTSMSITDNTNVKLLVKRSGSVIDFFVNGSKLTTTQQTTNTAFTFRSLGWAYNNAVYKVGGDIKKALVFESALTDAECIALTTI